MVSVMELVRQAKKQVENLPPGEMAKELANGGGVLVDVLEPTGTAGGVIPGAVLAPRGMLEFHADPATKYHLPTLAPDKRVILYAPPVRAPHWPPGPYRASATRTPLTWTEA